MRANFTPSTAPRFVRLSALMVVYSFERCPMIAKSIPVFVALVLAVACSTVPPTSPTGSTITVTASQASIAVGGSIDVRATVTTSNGAAVSDGATVTFTGGLGTFNPRDAQTINGIARTVYTATSSGVTKIGAMSGSARSNDVDLRTGAAAVEHLTVRTDPATLPVNGGTVTIIASAQDATGAAMANTPITFSADSGQLAASSSNTDSNGEARVQMATTRSANITAAAGSRVASVTLSTAVAPTLTLSNCSAFPVAGSAMICSVSANTPTTVHVNWGDGTSDDHLGLITTSTATHVYQRSGVYVVTAFTGTLVSSSSVTVLQAPSTPPPSTPPTAPPPSPLPPVPAPTFPATTVFLSQEANAGLTGCAAFDAVATPQTGRTITTIVVTRTPAGVGPFTITGPSGRFVTCGLTVNADIFTAVATDSFAGTATYQLIVR